MVVIWVFICTSIVTSVFSAAIAEDVEEQTSYKNVDSDVRDYLRGKRINKSIYPTSCAAAAATESSSMPVAVAPETAYLNNFMSPQNRYVPNTYDYANSGYQREMYTAEDPYKDTRELLRFSDSDFMEEIPASRFAFRTAPYGQINTGNMAGLSGQYIPPPGSVYGGYPSSNAGCAIPIRVSCTPSVFPGQMVSPQTLYGSASSMNVPHQIHGGSSPTAVPHQVFGSPSSMAGPHQGYGSPSSMAGPHQGYGSSPSMPIPHPNSYREAAEQYLQRVYTNQDQAVHDNSAPVNKVPVAQSNEKLP